MTLKKKILFVCTSNSCRSQIAHGLLSNIAGDRFDVFSAGLSPNKVHPMAIEVMKELPITLMLRPFDLNTLPVKIYEYTSEGEWEKASISALILMGLAISFTFLMNKNRKLSNEF